MSSIKAVLFDLDGTLLDANMSVFLPRYFTALSARIAHLCEPQRFVPHLWHATEAMAQNDGRGTNQEVFVEAFFPFEGHEREELQPIFDDFYARDFPKLRGEILPVTGARETVQRVVDHGCDVAVVTNPVFPISAIFERLHWANVLDLPWRWITSYETSHFTKPSLGFFSEVIARLGYPAEACLVVGDEHMDMVAKSIGCRTYLVTSPTNNLKPETPEPTYRGPLLDLPKVL